MASWATRFRRRQKLKGSLWMVPLGCAVAGPLLAELAVALETHVELPSG